MEINRTTNQIESLVKQIATGKKEQTPLEKVRTMEAKSEITSLETQVSLSNRLEIRIGQQADVLGMINEQTNKAYELMINDDSYGGQNAEVVNAELRQIRDTIEELMNTKNIQGETMFDKTRQQYDGNGRLINEYGDGTSIRDSIAVIDNFITNKDKGNIEDLVTAQEGIRAEQSLAGLKMQNLTDAREVSNSKIQAYKEIQQMNEDADLVDLTSRLAEAQNQLQIQAEVTKITNNLPSAILSLFT